MEFSEYLQLDRMAHWPRLLRHPLDMTAFISLPSSAELKEISCDVSFI